MRWPVLLTICLSVFAIGLEQSPVVAQILPGIAPACGGCGQCNTCVAPRPLLRRPLMGNRRLLRRPLLPGLSQAGCTTCMQPTCVCPQTPPPLPAPICSSTTTTTCLRPRQEVSYCMVPQTTCREEQYCVKVPFTRMKQVVINVPETCYRDEVRTRMVPQQVMVQQARYRTVWEKQTYVSNSAPNCVVPQTPDCCVPGALGTQGMQPTLTVPSTPTYQNKVPNPTPDSISNPNGNNQSNFRPWNPGMANNPYYQTGSTSGNRGGYRTLN